MQKPVLLFQEADLLIMVFLGLDVVFDALLQLGHLVTALDILAERPLGFLVVLWVLAQQRVLLG